MPPLLILLAVVVGGAGLLLLVTPGKGSLFRTQRRLSAGFTMRGRIRRKLSIAKPFGSGEIVGNVPSEAMASMVLGGVIPGGRVAYIVDVVGDGEAVDASGRYRAIIDTDASGATEIVFGAIMPADSSRQLGLAEYFVDETRGTVGFAGFSFQGTEHLMFNVRGVETAGAYRITVKWRGFEID